MAAGTGVSDRTHMPTRHLDRWRSLAPDGSDAFVTDPRMREKVYAEVYQEFAALMHQPDLAMPWPAWYDLEGELPATVALSVPPSVLPSELPLYMQDIRSHEGHNLSLSLQLLDAERYGRTAQIKDLAQRVVYALSAGATRIDFPLPFQVRRDGDHVAKQPREMLMVMRTLIATLGGATFKGKVPIAEGVDAFLFDRNGQGILALWDRGSVEGVRTLALNLGERPVSVDLWGNVTPLLRAARRQGRGAGPAYHRPDADVPDGHRRIAGADARQPGLRSTARRIELRAAHPADQVPQSVSQVADLRRCTLKLVKRRQAGRSIRQRWSSRSTPARPSTAS